MAIYNSIRNDLSKDAVLSEIRLQLTSPLNKNKSIILFEGLSDVVFFESLIENNSLLIESYGGKSDVIETIKNFADYRLIAIIDKDYDPELEEERIFYCDYCNVEMMIISNENLFDRVLTKLLLKKDDYTTLRNDVLQSLKCLSFLRQDNDINDWGIDFTKISIQRLLGQKMIVELEILKSEINSKSDIKLDEEKEREILKNKDNSIENLLNITNGHDFCRALPIFLTLRYEKQKKKMSEDDIRTILSIGYTEKFFKETQLFNKLMKYQGKYNLSIVSGD